MMKKGLVFSAPPFTDLWQDKDPFAEVDHLYGDVVRHMNGRRTMRFEVEGRGFYLKSHKGIGWKEYFKNVLQFKRPAVGARDEYTAIRKLEELGVPTMTPAAFGERGLLPPLRESFLITEELTGVISLEDLCRDWKELPPAPREKHKLIEQLAWTLSMMHSCGMNHRDCYICHFLLKKEEFPALYVIDLHRAQIREKVPMHYLLKDLGGIWFSAMDANLSKRDVLRFLKAYTNEGLHNLDCRFWKRVDAVARKLYFKEFGKESPAVKL